MYKTVTCGEWSIDDLRGIFVRIIQRRYANKKINPNYYVEISVDNKPIKNLTDEEFKAGKPGYITF
jgi:hypothetical protein